MDNFINNEYSTLASDLIKDAFYLDDRSKRGAIATIRTYTEIIIRRILNLQKTQKMTIGDHKIKTELRNISNNNKMFMDALEKIQQVGNIATHSQIDKIIGEEEFNKVVDSLMDVYAYLFVNFFDEFEFGSNLEIVSAFSILPPIIRYKALNNLYEKYPDNLMIIDKLSLSILKAFNSEIALNWVEEKKDILEIKPTMSKKVGWEIVLKHGYDYFKVIEQNSPKNMYILCKERLINVSQTISNRGLLYDSFETAISLYKERGTVQGVSEDVLKFNSLMEFIYLGRREEYNEKMKDINYYNTAEFRW